MPASPKNSFHGALRLARYNWPLYLAGGTAFLLGAGLATQRSLPRRLRQLAAVGASGSLWLSLASFGAFHWMFDRSEFTRWTWLPLLLGKSPARWVHLSAGLAEAEAPLQTLFPESEGRVLDIFRAEDMGEPALNRARQQLDASPSEPARLEALPVDSGWAEAIFVVLAAHEIRDKLKRERLFEELKRILADTGQLILVEHPRNLAGSFAFGPGVLHFLPSGEWRRLGRLTGLELEQEYPITPFIRVFCFRKAAI